MDANQLIAQNRHCIAARQFTMEQGQHDPPHQHPWHQLLLAKSGVLRTRTAYREYFVPYNRAVLIPADCVHESWAIGKADFIGIYINPTALPLKESNCQILQLTDLYRELVLHLATTVPLITQPNEKDRNLATVFCDLTPQQKTAQFELTLPRDSRIKTIANRLLADPTSPLNLSDWASQVGASERTIGRLFTKETGLTFARWRQRLRLYHALPMIEQKHPVHVIALQVGYRSASAFIHSFKQEFGVTPQQYC